MIIGIPRRDHFVEPWKFSHSLLNLLRYEDSKGRVHNLIVAERSNASKGKMELARQAMMSGEDLFLIDTDMVFPPNTLELVVASQLEANADIISGYALMGSEKREPAIFKPMAIGEPFERWVNHPSGVIETGGSGMYFTLIKNNVIMELKHKAFLEEDYCDERVEGDLIFCMKARKAGFKIFCDTSIKIGHLRSLIL